MKRFLLLLLILSGCSPFRGYLEKRIDAPPGTNGITVVEPHELALKDGTVLSGMLFLPKIPDRVPTILVRMPLPDELNARMMARSVGEVWSRRGYAVLIQGVRGRYRSEGEFEPFMHEREDGLETLAWIRSQGFSNGKVVMWGSSYFAFTQWAVADELDGMFVHIGSSNLHQTMRPGGTFALSSALYWLGRDRGRLLSDNELARAVNRFPVSEADEAIGGDSPYFNQWTVGKENKYWLETDYSDRRAAVRAPVLFLAGWYDPFLPAQLEDFRALRQSANSTVAGKTRLIIGPWAHAETVRMADGTLEEDYRVESLKPALAWYDAVLSGRGDSQPRVLLYVMGKNEWRAENEWPLARARSKSLYLSSSGALNDTPSSSESFHSFIYDPKRPLPTTGGAYIGEGTGPRLQKNPKPKDVLLYTSAPLEKDTEVTGTPRAVVFMTSDAPTTDIFVRLADVWPDGRSFNVTDGMKRIVFSPGTSAPAQIEIELFPTSQLFKAGHRIRVQISSSNFPLADRNTNTLRTLKSIDEAPSAAQRIYHSGELQSRLVLPIIP